MIKISNGKHTGYVPPELWIKLEEFYNRKTNTAMEFNFCMKNEPLSEEFSLNAMMWNSSSTTSWRSYDAVEYMRGVAHKFSNEGIWYRYDDPNEIMKEIL